MDTLGVILAIIILAMVSITWGEGPAKLGDDIHAFYSHAFPETKGDCK